MQFWIFLSLFVCAFARQEFLSSAKYDKTYYTSCKGSQTYWEAESSCSRDGRLFQPTTPTEVKEVSDTFKKVCDAWSFWTDVSKQKQGICGYTWRDTYQLFSLPGFMCSGDFPFRRFVCEKELTDESDESNSSEERHKLLMNEIAALKLKVRRLG